MYSRSGSGSGSRGRRLTPEELAFSRSEGAKKRTALKWVNKARSPPPSLHAYAPAWWHAQREERRRDLLRRYGVRGEGSSSVPAPPSSLSSVSSDADFFRTPSPPPSRVVVDADFTNGSDEEGMAFELAMREFELAANTESEMEAAVVRRAIALVERREAREREKAAASTTAGASTSVGASTSTGVVKRELADLIDLTDE